MTRTTEQFIDCEVVVVGAGPGGSTAAYWLARAGIDVLLVDKVDFPRHKPCGDGLTPRAVDMLVGMGLAVNTVGQSQPVQGVRIFTDDDHSFVFDFRPGASFSREGLVIPRFDLDDALRRNAMQAGAHFISGVGDLSPSIPVEQQVELQGWRNGQRLAIQAQLLILATGANRTLIQKLMLASAERDAERPGGLALRVYMAGVTPLDGRLEVYLDQTVLPGYAWVFPTSSGLVNIGVGMSLDGLSTAEGGQRLRRAFERLLHRRRLAGGQLLGRPQGYPLRTDFPDALTHGPRFLVVGEAAGLVDPLTGEGIALALESGHLAADVAQTALRSGNFSIEGLRGYGDILCTRHATYFADARDLLARLSHPKVIETVVKVAQRDGRVREAVRIAIVDGHPRDSIALLDRMLHTNEEDPLAGPLFTLNAYRPLLDRCRTYLLAQVRPDTPSPHILPLLERGKMLRALLVFLGCQAAGGDPESVIAAAAGIELVHAASLIHDDIMDEAATRRGLPALHVTLGIARAIICGDYLIAKSFRLLAESRTTSPAAHVVEAFIIGAESGIRTCAGQFQDVGTLDAQTFNETTYHRHLASKTAAAIAGALSAGAALAGGNRALIDVLARYGDCVGRAFQIKDDLLDLTDLPARLDAIDRRLSLPLIVAFQRSHAAGRQLICSFLAGHPVDATDLVQLLQITNAPAHAETVAIGLVEEAIEQARVIPQVPEVLTAFARYVIIRPD
jgi:geranylgeranyl reductase family protein